MSDPATAGVELPVTTVPADAVRPAEGAQPDLESGVEAPAPGTVQSVDGALAKARAAKAAREEADPAAATAMQEAESAKAAQKESSEPSEDELAALTGTACCGIPYATQPHELMPYHPSRYMLDRAQIRREVLAGLVVAFIQITESMAFALIAGLDPLSGLHAAWIMGLTVAVLGTRPAVIHGSTGVRAAMLAPYVDKHGPEMAIYIVLMCAVVKTVAGLFKIARLMRMVPRSVAVGFVCGLAVILALGQVPAFQDHHDDWLDSTTVGYMFFVAASVVVTINLWSKVPVVGPVIPRSLAGILVAVFLEHVVVRQVFGFEQGTPLIEDEGELSGGFPTLFWNDDDLNMPTWNWDTFMTALWPAVAISFAGSVECVLTLDVVSAFTETNNPKPDEHIIATGVGDLFCGLFGTMGGGSAIGMSMANVTNGANGRYRISMATSAIVVLLSIVVAAPIVKKVPAAALVGVMCMVCYGTFEWQVLRWIAAACAPESFRERHPKLLQHKIRRMDLIVIVMVAVVTVAVDLTVSVVLGVLVTSVDFAWRVGSQLTVSGDLVDDGARKVYTVRGAPLFFASSMDFPKQFDYANDPPNIEIHFAASSVNDYSALHALNLVSDKYKSFGKEVHLRNLNLLSGKILRKADGLTGFTYQLSSHTPEGELEVEHVPSGFHLQEAIKRKSGAVRRR